MQSDTSRLDVAFTLYDKIGSDIGKYLRLVSSL